MSTHSKPVPANAQLQPAASALPRRTPGLVGNEFEPLVPTADGPPTCFECGCRLALFSLGTVQPALNGASLALAFPVCELCVGKVSAELPPDVDIFITRLPKEEN